MSEIIFNKAATGGGGGGSFIQNGTIIQTGANFNIDGEGEMQSLIVNGPVDMPGIGGAGVLQSDATGNITTGPVPIADIPDLSGLYILNHIGTPQIANFVISGIGAANSFQATSFLSAQFATLSSSGNALNINGQTVFIQPSAPQGVNTRNWDITTQFGAPNFGSLTLHTLNDDLTQGQTPFEIDRTGTNVTSVILTGTQIKFVGGTNCQGNFSVTGGGVTNIAASSISLNGPTTVNASFTLNLGGDAPGDIYYRSATGTIARLPIGTPGQVLDVAENSLPQWISLLIRSIFTGPDFTVTAQSPANQPITALTFSNIQPGLYQIDAQLNVLNTALSGGLLVGFGYSAGTGSFNLWAFGNTTSAGVFSSDMVAGFSNIAMGTVPFVNAITNGFVTLKGTITVTTASTVSIYVGLLGGQPNMTITGNGSFMAVNQT